MSQRIQDQPLVWPFYEAADERADTLRRVEPPQRPQDRPGDGPEAAKAAHRRDAAEAAQRALQAAVEAIGWFGVTDPGPAAQSQQAITEVEELIDRIAIARGEPRRGRGRNV